MQEGASDQCILLAVGFVVAAELRCALLDAVEVFMHVTTPDSGDVTHHPFPQEIDHFIDCIRNDKETEVSLADAMKTQAIVFAADKSAAEGHPVKLPLD